MKKLSVKLKNVPRNTQLVPCSTNSSLNREETLSVKSKVLTNNTSEVDLRQHTVEKILSSVVYVISKNGKVLMPTSPRKARILLKEKRAYVLTRKPFVIQLNYVTTEFIQEVKLGIDSGAKEIGFSASSNKKELISGELTLDNKTSERLTERRMYRRGRRSKLWYRKPRFNNRKKKDNWLPPSIKRKYDTHLTLIKKIRNILPISNVDVIVEVGNFDIQKINNPNIEGKEYQEGNLKDYLNIKSYIITREKGKCQLCNKEKGEDSWNIHHLIQRSKGGTNKESNLSLLHKKCHKKLHESDLKLKVNKNKSYKEATFMNIIKNRFQKDLNCEITFGYITESNRRELEIEKSHVNDAFVISGSKIQKRVKPFSIIQKHRNNRVLQLNRKGFKPSIRKERYKIQVGDSFWINRKEYISKGIKNKGEYILYGDDKKKEYFSIKKVEKVFNNGSLIWN